MATEETGAGIEHVVVLMLENRAFDHMFGFLDHPGLPRLTPNSFPNRLDPKDPSSPATGVSDDAGYSLPVDAPHSHLSVLKQMNGRRRARMDGFVAAYAEQASGHAPRPVIHWGRLEAAVLIIALIPALLAVFGIHPVVLGSIAAVLAVAGTIAVLYMRTRSRPRIDPNAERDAPRIMSCMAQDRIPVLATLARGFAVCTRWHCSVPGETWPNRNFAHAATSDGTVDIEIGFYDSRTVFELLQEAGRTWRIYHDGRAQVMAFNELWEPPNGANWFAFSAFPRHVAAGRLPAYSFIEPDHLGQTSNSQHPGNNLRPHPDGTFDFQRGEALIATTYEALRANPALFDRTLLLVTYDEHGGLFDHVPPPTNVPAPTLGKAAISFSRRLVAWFVTTPRARFDFQTLGPRVPAVVVSPRVPRGLVDDTPYDHSSIVATLRALFAPRASPLTRRDAKARTFEHLVRLAGPRTGDLPDLSSRIRPGLGAPPAETVPEAGPAAGRPDTLAMQLELLGQKVDRRLDELGAPPAPAIPEAAPAEGEAEEPVARRFANYAEQQRAGSAPG